MPSSFRLPPARRRACSALSSSYPAVSRASSRARPYSPQSMLAPVGVVRGKSVGASRLRRRSSAGSIPSLPAARSMIRSSVTVASGRPAPRKAATGVVLVMAATAS